MKFASIREFRNSLAGHRQSQQMVLVTNHGKMVGCFLPLADTSDLPIELKKEFIAHMGQYISSSLTAKEVSEKDVLDDFKAFKKRRR